MQSKHKDSRDAVVCDHQPDWDTIQVARGAIGVIDVRCFKCREYGSIELQGEDVLWEEDEEYAP